MLISVFQRRSPVHHDGDDEFEDQDGYVVMSGDDDVESLPPTQRHRHRRRHSHISDDDREDEQEFRKYEKHYEKARLAKLLSSPL